VLFRSATAKGGGVFRLLTIRRCGTRV